MISYRRGAWMPLSRSCFCFISGGRIWSSFSPCPQTYITLRTYFPNLVCFQIKNVSLQCQSRFGRWAPGFLRKHLRHLIRLLDEGQLYCLSWSSRLGDSLSRFVNKNARLADIVGNRWVCFFIELMDLGPETALCVCDIPPHLFHRFVYNTGFGEQGFHPRVRVPLVSNGGSSPDFYSHLIKEDQPFRVGRHWSWETHKWLFNERCMVLCFNCLGGMFKKNGSSGGLMRETASPLTSQTTPDIPVFVDKDTDNSGLSKCSLDEWDNSSRIQILLLIII